MSGLTDRLRNLAASIENHWHEDVRAYAPKLKAEADRVETEFEKWQSAVEQWIDSHFAPAEEELRRLAAQSYHAVLRTAVSLYDEAKTRLHLA